MRLISLLLTMCLLTACSGGGSGGGGREQRPILPDFPNADGNILPEQRSLVFAYPAPGQSEIIPASPIVLRFSHPLADLTPATTAAQITIREVVGGQVVPYDLTIVDEGRGVMLQPRQPLKLNTRYQVVGSAVALTSGQISLQAIGLPPLEFRTRAALAGPTLTQVANGIASFTVSRLLPSPGQFPLTEYSGGFPIVDFSTLRLQFSQPVHPASARYGTTVKLMQGADLVPARLLVNGNRMTLDPVGDLDPTKEYQLMLATGLTSRFGVALTPGDYAAYRFTPRNSGSASGQLSRVRIDVPQTGLSLLTGTTSNEVPVASPLLGQGASAPRPLANGSLYADLAFAPNFGDFKPAVVPIRVPRNNLLGAGNLTVKLDGAVPAGLDTGKLTIKLLSDANGLLLPNKYSRSPAAPSLVTLAMDIAVSAEKDTASGAFTQDVLHAEVNGIATVDQATQTLKLEAIGTIELKILGVDDAVGILALKLESQLAGAQGSLAEDTVAPAVQSWVPGESVNGIPGGQLLRPGDPILVNFTEVPDINSLGAPNAIVLRRNGQVEPVSWRLDGVTLVLMPQTPLQYGANYSLTLSTAITDMAGKGLAADWSGSFTLPALVDNATVRRPPIALLVYPGYPCAVEAGTRNIGAGIQGRCAGGKTTDDLLPLPLIEPLLPIAASFSQELNPASVKLAGSCGGAGSVRVERVDASGACLGVVPGRLTVRPRELQFMPDQPWVAGQYYRYVLRSSGSTTSTTTDCSGNQAICGSNGLALQTQMIAQTLAPVQNRQHGGPDMEILFRGGAALGGTTIGLRVLPVLDVNSNFQLDDGERRATLRSNPATFCKTGQGADTPATTGSCEAPNGALLQPDRLTTGSSFSGAATRFSLGCLAGVGSEDEAGGTAGRDCQGNQFLLIATGLSARLGSSVPDSTVGNTSGKAIEVFINPGVVVTAGAQIYADLGLTPDSSPISTAIFDALFSLPGIGGLIEQGVTGGAALIDGLLPISVLDGTYDLPEGQVFTGPLVFRMRHPAGNGPIKGLIKSVNGKLILETQLDLYTDIPEINAIASILGQPAIPIEHDVRSSLDLTKDATASSGSGTIKVSGEVRFLPDGRLTVRLSNVEPVRLTANLSALGGLVSGALKVRVAAGRFTIDAGLAPLKH